MNWFKRKVQIDMTSQIIGTILRALLAGVGGAGMMSDGETEQLSGAIGLVASIAWGVYRKYQAGKAAKVVPVVPIISEQ